MMMMIAVLCPLLLAVSQVLAATTPAATTTTSVHWDYDVNDPHGPLHWGGICETVGRQSPIDIDLSKTILKPSLAGLNTLQFKNYDITPSSLVLSESNNGHTTIVVVNGTLLPSIMSGGLNYEYFLRQFHFHWGPNDLIGSEHTLAGHHYPLELHLVHTTNDQIAPAGEKIAVVGVMFELDDHDNDHITKIITNLHSIIHVGDSVPLNQMSLTDVLPDNKKLYFRYPGSLTTPPCSESVMWTVLFDRSTISSAQVAQFRQLLDPENLQLDRTFRPIQPIANRVIWSSFPPTVAAHALNGAVRTTAAATVLLAAALMLRFL